MEKPIIETTVYTIAKRTANKRYSLNFKYHIALSLSDRNALNYLTNGCCVVFASACRPEISGLMHALSKNYAYDKYLIAFVLINCIACRAALKDYSSIICALTVSLIMGVIGLLVCT